MPTFVYAGYDPAGHPLAGRLWAPSEEVARGLLRERRITPETLRLPWWGRELGPPRVKREEVAVLTQQMAALLRADLRPREVLDILQEDLPGAGVKRVLYDLSLQVQRGRRLSEATRAHPRVFGEVYSASLAAGEDAGALQRVMERLASGLARSVRTRREFASGLTYPAILLGVVALVTSGLLYFVVPQFAQTLAEMGGELPLVTRVLLGAARVARYAVPAGALVGVGGVAALRLGMRRSRRVRLALDRLLLRLPWVGPLGLEHHAAEFAWIFGLLHATRVSVVEAVRLAADTVGNRELRGLLHEVAEGHARGRPLSQEMRRVGRLPGVLVALIRTGEETGSMAEQMEVAAEHFRERVAYHSARISTSVGPLAVVACAVPVVFVAIGLYLPMIAAAKAMM